MKQIKATSYINTMLNEEYRIYVSQPFTVELFADIITGWKTLDNIPVAKFYNSRDKSIIEFFGNNIPYKITNPKLVGDKTFLIPFPQNLDQFICDCERCFVDLHWNNSILSKFDRKYLMKQSELQSYFDELLTKLNK